MMQEKSLTAEDMAEWKRLAEAATPGPWEMKTGSSVCRIVHADGSQGAVTSTKHTAEMLFIAASRTAMPRLIAEVERTRGFIEAFIGEAADCDCDPDRLDAKSGEAFSAMLGNHIEENCELRDKIEKAEAALAEKDAEIARLQANLESIQSAYRGADKTVDDLDKEIVHLQAEAAFLREKLEMTAGYIIPVSDIRKWIEASDAGKAMLARVALLEKVAEAARTVVESPKNLGLVVAGSGDLVASIAALDGKEG